MNKYDYRNSVMSLLVSINIMLAWIVLPYVHLREIFEWINDRPLIRGLVIAAFLVFFIQPLINKMIKRRNEKKNKIVLTEADKKCTAIHEAGHAIIFAALREPTNCIEVSIQGFSDETGGYNHIDEKNGDKIWTTSAILSLIACYLGGRAAEDVVFQTITGGAGKDLERIDQLLDHMLMGLGMSSNYPNLCVRSDAVLPEHVKAKLFEERQGILNEQYARAKALIEHNRSLVEAIAEALLQHTRLNGEQLQEFLRQVQVPAE